MDCRKTRDLLAASRSATERSDRASSELRRHLESCAACASFAARLELAGELLGRRGLELEPDAGFVARVQAALPDPPQILGWAALRVLPVTLALALVLGGWTYLQTQAPSALVEESPSDDLLTWVMETEEVTR